MADNANPQDVQDQEQPKQDVKPTEELSDEQLENVAGGIIINWQPAPTAPQVSPPSEFRG
jgi:hypothetical protein